MLHDHWNRFDRERFVHDHERGEKEHYHEIDDTKPDNIGKAVFRLPPEIARKMSVLQDWVMELPLREQGTLLTGIRGCDLAPKNPACIDESYGCSTGEDTTERTLSAFLRYCVLNPADPREVDHPGAWFQSKPPTDWKPSQLGHYPLHWYSHLMHCFEVVAYRHPDPSICHEAGLIYFRLVKSLHLNPESKDEMIARLSEDRIASDSVVS